MEALSEATQYILSEDSQSSFTAQYSLQGQKLYFLPHPRNTLQAV